jgi:hypothetical protein
MIETASKDPLFEFDILQVDVARWLGIGERGTRGAVNLDGPLTRSPTTASPVRCRANRGRAAIDVSTERVFGRDSTGVIGYRTPMQSVRGRR